MKKYTNKILTIIILLVAVLILSVPIAVWFFRASLIKTMPDPNQVVATTEYLSYKGFNTLDIRGSWQVQILPGTFKVELNDPQNARFIHLNQEMLTLDNSTLKQQQLSIIIIHLPEIKQLSMSGASKISVTNFTQNNTNQLGLDLSGASELIINNSNYRNIKIEMSGTSNLKFKNSELELVNLDASGVSTLELDHLNHGKLMGNSSGMTNIYYNGTLDENGLDSSGISNISGSSN